MSPLIAAVVLIAASHRNPFQYVETPKPKPVERRALSAPEPRRAESPPLHIVETKPVVPPPPEFPYQLIGRFGRGDNLIVAFSGKGQVITARVGDTIEETFVIRRVGIDSVEIGYVNRPETLRLQL